MIYETNDNNLAPDIEGEIMDKVKKPIVSKFLASVQETNQTIRTIPTNELTYAKLPTPTAV